MSTLYADSSPLSLGARWELHAAGAGAATDRCCGSMRILCEEENKPVACLTVQGEAT